MVFATLMRWSAWVSDMIPTLTKPMTMTVTAPLDWIAAVPSVPMPTPMSLLLPV